MSSDIGFDVLVTAVLLVEALVMRWLALVLVVVGLALSLVM